MGTQFSLMLYIFFKVVQNLALFHSYRSKPIASIQEGGGRKPVTEVLQKTTFKLYKMHTGCRFSSWYHIAVGLNHAVRRLENGTQSSLADIHKFSKDKSSNWYPSWDLMGAI